MIVAVVKTKHRNKLLGAVYVGAIQILGLLRNDGIILLDIDLLGYYINTTIMFSQMAHGRIKLIHRHREA